MAEDSKKLSEQEKLFREQRRSLVKQKKETEGKEKTEEQEKAKKETIWYNALEDLLSGNLKKIFLLPFKIISDLLHLKIVKNFMMLGLIVLIAVLGWGFIYTFISGGGAGFLGTETSVVGSKIAGPFSAVADQVVRFYKDPVGTIASFGEFKNPQIVEKKEPQGVEFTKIQSRRTIHRSGLDDIEIIANLKIHALKETPSQVEFSCFIDDVLVPLEGSLSGVVSESAASTAGEIAGEIGGGIAGTHLGALSSGVSAGREVGKAIGETLVKSTQGQIEIFGESSDNKIIDIFPGQGKSLSFSCKFDPVTLYITKERTTSQKITLNAVYKDFVTRSRLKVYTLEEDILQGMINNNVNPFVNFKVSDPLLSSDRSIRPEQLIDSPGILSLSLIDSQPLTTDRKYLLGINLFNDKIRWNGRLTKLKSLKIFLPQGFNPTEGSCKEFFISDSLLVLKPEFMQEEINELKFFCDFGIDSSAVNEDLSFSLINAEAIYDYQFQAFTSAIISQHLLTSSLT